MAIQFWIFKNENIIYSEEPVVLRKIADEPTIESVREMLRGVVVKGTGKNADIPGWKVAGKTGTAQKWKNGNYPIPELGKRLGLGKLLVRF